MEHGPESHACGCPTCAEIQYNECGKCERVGAVTRRESVHAATVSVDKVKRVAKHGCVPRRPQASYDGTYQRSYGLIDGKD